MDDWIKTIKNMVTILESAKPPLKGCNTHFAKFVRSKNSKTESALLHKISDFFQVLTVSLIVSDARTTALRKSIFDFEIEFWK